MVLCPVLQDRKIAHCPFHVLMPAERETFLARKRLLDHMGFQLRCAVLSKESQWDPKALYLSKRGGPRGASGFPWGRAWARREVGAAGLLLGRSPGPAVQGGRAGPDGSPRTYCGNEAGSPTLVPGDTGSESTLLPWGGG